MKRNLMFSKRIITISLITSMAFSIVGCGNKGDAATESGKEGEGTVVSTEVPGGSSEKSITGRGETETNSSSNGMSSAETEKTGIQLTEAEADSSLESETPITEESPEDEYDYAEDLGLTETQLNKANMLNYMTALTQEINENKDNQLLLETIYDSFDNLYPDSVDMSTQAQVFKLMDTINAYRMISEKRRRLQYIYEQNQAQALRQAIPNPIALLSAAQSGNPLSAAASILYMAVDSATSYKAAKSQADLQFVKDGWELDDENSAQLHESTKDALSYMFDMVRSSGIPGDLALSKEAIEDFATWSSKPDSQIDRKIKWLERHEETYKRFGPYWLTLATCYYNDQKYAKCLDAIKHYEAVSSRIFRKNIDYAQALPMAIVSMKETSDDDKYVSGAERYCKYIIENTKDSDWSIRYFVAQTYMDLFTLTEDTDYLKNAYSIIYDNVNELVDVQKGLNTTYLEPVEEVEAKKDATKREKEEVKQYNSRIKDEREKELPPVCEALYLNCDLLFALADRLDIDSEEKEEIESMLHEDGNRLFLTEELDKRFWFEKTDTVTEASDIIVSFDGGEFSIPATYVSDRSSVRAMITGESGGYALMDWKVESVDRNKSDDPSDFIVTYESLTGEEHKYSPGDEITIKVVPVAESPDDFFEFKYKVVGTKNLYVFDDIKYERVYE